MYERNYLCFPLVPMFSVWMKGLVMVYMGLFVLTNVIWWYWFVFRTPYVRKRKSPTFEQWLLILGIGVILWFVVIRFVPRLQDLYRFYVSLIANSGLLSFLLLSIIFLLPEKFRVMSHKAFPIVQSVVSMATIALGIFLARQTSFPSEQIRATLAITGGIILLISVVLGIKVQLKLRRM